MPKRTYLTLQNFAYGLDTRKSVLTSQPGTLLQLNNGHVNQGGEIENRKAFTVIDNANPTLPTGCFGMEITSSGITTFGSIATPSGLPAGVTYQRLTHPNGTTAMSGVVYSTSFNGNAWVIANFIDENVYAYYNGALVTDLTDGEVLRGLNGNNALATALAAVINRSTSTQGYSATATTNSVGIVSPIGQSFTESVTEVSASGSLSGVFTTGNTPAVANIAATAQFRIVAGVTTTTCKISSVMVNATPNLEILGTAVQWTTSNENTTVLVAAQINTNSGTTNYTASANGAVVTIYAATASGATPNTFKLQVISTANTTAADGLMIGDCSFSFSGVPSVTNILANGVAITTGGPFTASDNGTLCYDLAVNINAYAATSGYIAFVPQVAGVNQNFIRISKTHTRSDDASVNINPTLTAGGFVAGSGNPLVITLSTYAGAGTVTTNSGILSSNGVTLTAYASGGSNNGFTYKWTIQNSIYGITQTQQAGLFLLTSTTNATTIVNVNTGYYSAYANPFVSTCELICTVTDSAGNVSVSPICSISFS